MVEEWSRIDVTRGFSPPLLEKYDQWSFEAKAKGTDVIRQVCLAFVFILADLFPSTEAHMHSHTLCPHHTLQ